MLDEFKRHNLFLEDLELFKNNDPHLSLLKGLKYVYTSNWWNQIDWAVFGIYILTGGRQIGKSTSTKLLIEHIIGKKIFSPKQVFYLPCDQIDDYHHLFRIIKLFLDDIQNDRFLIIIDEVTFVKEWDRAIKALADDGSFRNGVCILTGSDSVVLKDASLRFPGRRGNAEQTDFHIHPLSFLEYIKLVSPNILEKPQNYVNDIYDQFSKFQQCGGYLRAINDLHSLGEIRKATYLTFEQWIRGDFEKRNKNVDILKCILKALLETTGTQVTYSSLAHKMGQVVKETFIDYVGLLERMDIVFPLQVFDQNTMLGFPKKAKKIHFADPFIMDTVSRWLISERLVEEREWDSIKAESIVASDCRKKYPTYYIKAEGEIDIVIVQDKKFTPVEIKWTNQLRLQDAKQLTKYKNSILLTKTEFDVEMGGVKTISLPLFLLTQL